MTLITIEKKDLQGLLGKVAPVINPASLMPIMKNVLIDISDAGMTLTGSDLDTIITVSDQLLQVPVGQEQKFSVDAKLLLDLLKTLPNGTLSLEVTDNLKVITSKGDFTIPVIRGEYPETKEWTPTESSTLKGFILDTVLGATLSSVSVDDMRPTMTGVCFDFLEEGATFVSTNGFKLHRYITRTKGSGTKIIVPPKVLAQVTGLQDEEVKIEFNDSNILFTYVSKDVSYKVSGRLIDGKYPPYDKVVPSSLSKFALIDQAEVIDTVKRVSLFSPGETKEVTFSFKNGALQISATNANYATSGAETLPIEYSQEPTQINFNATYLIDVLKTAGQGKVKMSFGPESNAVLVNNQASPGLTGLVMPLQS